MVGSNAVQPHTALCAREVWPLKRLRSGARVPLVELFVADYRKIVCLLFSVLYPLT